MLFWARLSIAPCQYRQPFWLAENGTLKVGLGKSIAQCPLRNRLPLYSLCDNMYEIYTSDVKKALNNLLNRLNFKELLLTHEEQSLFNDMFTTRSRKRNSSSRDVVPEDTTETIQKGIEKTELSMEEKSETSSESHTSSEPEEIIQEKVGVQFRE